MNLSDYISDRLEVATQELEKLSKKDEIPLVRFIEKLLDPNFILDSVKIAGPQRGDFDTSVFEGDLAKDLVTDITTYVKAVGNNSRGGVDVTGLMNVESRKRIRIAIETILNNIKSKPKKEIDQVELKNYLVKAKNYGQTLAESWNKNEFTKDGDINTKIKMLYLLNVVDIYITGSNEKITMNMNGVKSGNIRLFVKFLLSILSDESNGTIDSLVTEFVAFAHNHNVVTGSAPGVTHGGAPDVLHGGAPDVLRTIPNFDTVEISIDSGKHEFEIMASNSYVPYAVSTTESDPVIVRNQETYNPSFLFTDRRFHNELARLLLGDPELSVYSGNAGEWASKLVNFFEKTYEGYRKISFKEEKRVYERKDGESEIEFRSFYDLLRLYNLKQKYGISPLSPKIAMEKLEFSRSVGTWVAWLLDQVEPYKQGSIRAYPFVREYAAAGGVVPDDAKFSKNPWVVWLLVGGTELPGETSGFFTDGSFGESKIGNYKSNEGHLLKKRTGNVLSKKIHNQYESLCYLKPENTIRYIVSTILGFVLSRNYADYNLYYDLKRNEPLTLFGGSAPRYRAGVLGSENYAINRQCTSLYRDIVILGAWYFKKIDDPSLNSIVTQMSGRWSTINQIFLDMRQRGGAYQVQDINTIIFRINHIIREFGAEVGTGAGSGDIHGGKAGDIYDVVLNDFIETFHIVLKAIVESRIPQALPLSLDIATTLDHYTKNLDAYRPVIELDSTIMERYNIDDSIVEKIYKIKNRYVSDLKVSSGAGTNLSTGDVRVLLESLNYQQSITKDTAESKVVEMVRNAANRGLIHTKYVSIFREIYKRATGENLPLTLSSNTGNPTRETLSKLENVKSSFPLLNTGIVDNKAIPNAFTESLLKRLVLDFRTNNYDQVEASLDDNFTNFSEYVNKNYEGTVIGSVHPMNNLIDIYNTVSVLCEIGDYVSPEITEYILVRYDPKRMSPIPNHVYDVFETLLANFIYMNDGQRDIDESEDAMNNAAAAMVPKITYMDSEATGSDFRENGTKGDKILFNEISLLNSRVNILRTTEYFTLPPVYMTNVYYNYFINYVRKNMTPTMQSTKLDEKNYVDVVFEIFKKGYFKSMQE